MSEITREELMAFTEANRATAVALEKISTCLEGIVQRQDRVLDKLSNGLTADVRASREVVTETNKIAGDISSDLNVCKWAGSILAAGVIGFEIFSRVVMHGSK